MVAILGIVNVTRDSFSDGGRFVDSAAAIAHARTLIADGAAAIDLGAESTHPDSEDVPAGEELRRLLPVLDALVADGVAVSVDTWKAEVMRAVIARGARMINDVHGLRDEDAVAAVAGSDVDVVVMHSRAAGARADRVRRGGPIVDEVLAFFRMRLAGLEAAGIAPDRVVVDPGMGFFLGPDAATSLAMLRDLGRLRELGCRVLVGTSRKSFLGEVTGRPVERRGAATLASELWAAAHGADWIRTHDVAALRDGLAVVAAIERPGGATR